ncbi:S-DNA-T family DNA segregation ATPase FtsK/SpoIIIE [Scopulibacillus darangshiensis]|uniref:S-DNA-T family DNA segregation ATPase FtsK/SpoIIIE n=1 Tax=Scopulibacillus darangshiensis TaxID=442528 RepID=A0A4R2PE57_9BACL|nr:FtsK/SpoIIIE domain-containing protein [Scopulibacillus darangshiensis]TCP32205.1 S-DNA-T family DNA segregation ATPase FtsK/SpoIIIE [Scopulibacillus darangshiensis]
MGPELAIITAVSLAGYLIWNHDKNLSKLNKIFKNWGLMAGEALPVFKGKEGVVYKFKLPMGLVFDQMKAKEDAFNESFPFNAVELDFVGGLLHVIIADQLPKMLPFKEDMLKGKWSIPIGQSIRGMIYHDFNKIPHILAAGITRYGKTVWLRLLMLSIILQQPKQSKLVAIDLKGGLSFMDFEKLKQTHCVASDIAESVEALREIADEIKGRQKWFKEKGIQKIQQAGKRQKRVFIIIDEAAQLMSNGRTGKEKLIYRECERLLEYIGQVGGGLGFHLIYCTQYPTTKTLPQQVKANCDAVISFRLRNSTANNVVFDDVGMAEDLPHIPGRAVYQSDRVHEVQVPFVEDDQILELTKDHLKEDHDAPFVSHKDNTPGANTLVIE